jgi:colanic acid/amylovoran biosynthesis glycosyltransferase
MSNLEKTVCVVAPYEPSISETFIRAHVERIPARAFLIHGWRPRIENSSILSLPELVIHKLRRLLFNEHLNVEVTAAYVKAFRRHGVKAILAEYGETGVEVLPACRQLNIPLIVHFHGYDASVHELLERLHEPYQVMFKEAASVIAVSRAMQTKLISLGAPSDKVFYNPCGIDCEKFSGATPATAPPLFLAVGRFVEKKGPLLTIRAFASVYKSNANARLNMVGDGQLLTESKALVAELGLERAVNFLGAQSQEVVQAEMRKARCFVQHSLQAVSGDCEGTPVGILEAGASGLPVVSTRHAGIPDVVVDAETGLLVDEGDIDGMAAHMLRIVNEPKLAAALGQAAQKRISEKFSMERSIEGLWTIIERSITATRD